MEQTLLLRDMYDNLANELRLHKPLLPQDAFLRKLRVGDHLVVERLEGAYSHHGIYIGNNEVIHLHGQFFISHSSAKSSSRGWSNKCDICNYVKPRWGGVVRTCLDCFHGGSPFYIREYGIRVTGDTIKDWILDKLNSSGAIYTCRKGEIYIGKWTERNTVVHLIKMEPGPASHYFNDKNYNYCPDSGCLETSLQSFLCGGLLYINELELHVARHDGGNSGLACEDKPIVSIFRKLMKQTTDRVHEDWDNISCVKAGFRKLCSQFTPPSFIIYQNAQIQVCELASTKSQAETVHAAYNYLANGYGRYRVLQNNCEHFASNCRIGNAMCVQSENLQREAEDKRIQDYLDSCDPPSFSIPMETLMNTHFP